MENLANALCKMMKINTSCSVDNLWKKTIEKQAEFVDIVCFENAQNVKFLADQSSELVNVDGFPDWNPCSIGNTAYLALNAPEPYNQVYLRRLNTFLKWKSEGGITNDDGFVELLDLKEWEN